jgi:hypothetical protein
LVLAIEVVENFLKNRRCTPLVGIGQSASGRYLFYIDVIKLSFISFKSHASFTK